MQAPPSEKYTYPDRVPESTCDVNLKRARVVDNDGNSYIRVTGTVTSDDLDPIKEALGEPTDTSSDNTVIGLLKKIDVKQFGVGQSYPGSTGGEIFNYYGTDSDKNVASGDYSTAMGQSNTASGDYSCAIGGYNTAAGSFSFTVGSGNEANYGATTAIGLANTCNGSESIAIGHDNTVLEKCYAFGIHNTCLTDNKVIVGNNLRTISNNEMTMYGQYNYNTAALTNPTVIIASGSENNPVNAIECNTTTTKVRNNLQLATDSTEVNAITAPLSTPASADDKTVATKAYVDSQSAVTRTETSGSWAPGNSMSIGENKGLAAFCFGDQHGTSMHTLFVDTRNMMAYIGISQACSVDGYTFTYMGGTLTYDNTNTDGISPYRIYYIFYII